ncbi:MAG TPA: hypothetical protein VMU79_01820 [Casimicrobiaceae bacterium]|nr:hypothetical protein [Casimicrobiaceae bacterium]
MSFVTDSSRQRSVQISTNLPANSISSSDELFFLLEGQTVRSRGNNWRIQVCGVYSTAVDRWIQLSLSGPLACGMTLRTGFRDADGVLDLLRDWLDGSLPSDLEPCIVSQVRSDESQWMDYSDIGQSPTLTM